MAITLYNTASPSSFVVEKTKKVASEMAALNRFGSPDAIARHLEWLGIRGFPGNARTCVVARYLNHRGISDVYMQSGAVYFINGVDRVAIGNEPAVANFIVAFDSFKYPSLVEKVSLVFWRAAISGVGVTASVVASLMAPAIDQIKSITEALDEIEAKSVVDAPKVLVSA
jgi:hypothetical protein